MQNSIFNKNNTFNISQCQQEINSTEIGINTCSFSHTAFTSFSYFHFDENETDKLKDIDDTYFFDEAKSKFGLKGLKEAQEVISRASALFAGGELDDEAKELFYQSLMEVYMESKAEAREKFKPRKKQVLRNRW